MRVILPSAVIIVCAAALVFLSHREGYRAGFIQGKRFVLTVLRHVSPEAARMFRKDVNEAYQYDIFSELRKNRKE